MQQIQVAAIQKESKDRAAKLNALVKQYYPVARAVAEGERKRLVKLGMVAPLRGRLDDDQVFLDLLSLAQEEGVRAMRNFAFGLGYSAAPYFRRACQEGVKRWAEEQRLGAPAWAWMDRPDGYHVDDEDGRSRWEVLGDHDVTLEAAPERQELRAALAAYPSIPSRCSASTGATR